MTPWAANYGGHQFGHWAGQLGDGRALMLEREILHLDFGGECVASVETSGISLHELGPAPRFSAAVK